MNNLAKRAITATISGSMAVTAIILSPYGLWLFCFVVSMVALYEFLNAMKISTNIYLYGGIGVGIFIWLLFLLKLILDPLVAFPTRFILATGFLILPFFEIVVLIRANEKESTYHLSHIVLGFLYCYFPLILMFDMSVPAIIDDYVFWLPLNILFLTWILDTAAYFVGKGMGKHLLIPRISPKKTWEGAIGGAMACIGLGVFLEYQVPHSINWVVIAAIICVFSQIGDLVESMIKRSVEIKDSGNILPGHGGMLDRFDGLFLSVPFIYLYLSFL